MARWIIQKCPSEQGGIGGFITNGFSSLVDYTLAPSTTFEVHSDQYLYRESLKRRSPMNLLLIILYLIPHSRLYFLLHRDGQQHAD